MQSSSTRTSPTKSRCHCLNPSLTRWQRCHSSDQSIFLRRLTSLSQGEKCRRLYGIWQWGGCGQQEPDLQEDLRQAPEIGSQPGARFNWISTDFSRGFSTDLCCPMQLANFCWIVCWYSIESTFRAPRKRFTSQYSSPTDSCAKTTEANCSIMGDMSSRPARVTGPCLSQ